MQVAIGKKTGVALGTLAVLIIGLVAIIGFSRNNHDAHVMDHGSMNGSMNGSMHHDMNNNSSMVGSDVMFLQMMIPHHQQAVDLSALAIARSKDPEVLALAKNIRDGQTAEIAQMKNWLSAAGEATTPSHSMGDGTGGMLSQAGLATLQSLSGNAFDEYWLKSLIAHHEGALQMVMMISDSPKAQMQTFGSGIDDLQSAQIAQMKAMLKRLQA